MTEQMRVGRPAVVTPAERIEAAIPMADLIAKMSQEDCPNAVEAGRQLERITCQARALRDLLEHGRPAHEIELVPVSTDPDDDDDGRDRR